MTTKTTRYVDAQGRVILPAHIRKALNLSEGHCLEIELEQDGTIRLRPTAERCCICGKPVTGQRYVNRGDRHICWDCLQWSAYMATVERMTEREEGGTHA